MHVLCMLCVLVCCMYVYIYVFMPALCVVCVCVVYVVFVVLYVYVCVCVCVVYIYARTHGQKRLFKMTYHGHIFYLYVLVWGVVVVVSICMHAR